MARRYFYIVIYAMLLVFFALSTVQAQTYYGHQQGLGYYQTQQRPYYPRQQTPYYPRQQTPYYPPQQTPYYPPQQTPYYPPEPTPNDPPRQKPPHHQPPRCSGGTMGTLFVAGFHVTVNGQSGTNGRTICGGDKVATGSGSSALIRIDGRKVQLDQNTELDLQLHAPNDLKCTLSIMLKTGQIFLDGESTCVSNRRVLFATHSQVDYVTLSDVSALGLIKGEIVISKSPTEQVSVPAPARLVFSADGGILEQNSASEADLRLMMAWREPFNFQSP